jgi:Flp pilus assembly CpaF family ATPase
MITTAERHEYLKVLNTGHPGSVASFAVGMGIDALKRAVVVAHVTVGGETITVDAADIAQALIQLGGEPTAGQRLDVAIVYDSITLAAFLALPEWQ